MPMSDFPDAGDIEAIEHNSYVSRDVNGMWSWTCADHPDAESRSWATEDAATEDAYRHEGTDRASLLAEVGRLRARVALPEAGETRTDWGEVEYAVVEHHPETSKRVACVTSRRDDALAALGDPDVVEVMQRSVGPWVPVEDKAGGS